MNFYSLKFTVNLYRTVIQKFIFFSVTRVGCVCEINVSYGKTLTNVKMQKINLWIYTTDQIIYLIQVQEVTNFK